MAPHAAKRKSQRSIARAEKPNFGEVIRHRRRELNLTQREVASRINTSTTCVGHLESGKRHPSDQIVTRLAEVLDLDQRELFFLANPHVEALLANLPETAKDSLSAWDQFLKDKRLRQNHHVSNHEMEMLSRLVGCYFAGFRSARDLIFVLNTMRHAVRR